MAALAYIATMRLVAAASLVVWGTGCSWAVADDTGEGGERDASVQGTMHVASVVAYGAPTIPTNEQVRSQVTARFLRVEGLDGRTADALVGATVLPARPGSEVSELGCSYLSDEGVPSGGGSIELLDVGEILVHATAEDGGGDTLALAARAFPPVGDMISGVVYTSRDDATALPPAGNYLIETTGSASVEGFAIQVDAPGAPLDVLVSGVPISELGVDGDLAVGADGWTIHWAAGGSDGDIIYVDVVRVDGGDEPLRCVFEDGGAGSIPAAYLGHPPGSELEIAVHRYRQTRVRLAGFDGAYVDFDFAVSARVLIQ